MKRIALIFITIMAQIILTLTAGYMALNGAARSGGGILGRPAGAAASAAASIRERRLTRIESGLARFTYGDTDFMFHFSELGLTPLDEKAGGPRVDYGSRNYLASLLSAFTRNYDMEPPLSYSADAGAFRKKLGLMKQYIDRQPVDAGIDISDSGVIVRTPSACGTYLDADGQFERIYGMFLDNPLETFSLDAGRSKYGPVVSTDPRVTDAILADVDAVLSEITVGIPDGCDRLMVMDVAEAVNKVWAPRKGTAYDSFSFSRYLGEAGLPADSPFREYDFVASALFHALLVSGEDYAKMESEKSMSEESYPPLPGFGIALRPDGAGKAPDGAGLTDFKFFNTLNSNIVIFAYVTGDSLCVSVAGSSKLTGKKAAPHEIYSSIENGRALLYRNGKKIGELL